MKIRFLVLLCCFTNAYAEPEMLPPIEDHSIYPQNSGNRKKSSANPMSEILNRLNQLQHEVQQIRGQVEEQAYALEMLQQNQQTMFTDLDERLQKTENSQ